MKVGIKKLIMWERKILIYSEGNKSNRTLSPGCWTRKKNSLCVSITQQLRELCPVKILNIILCNLLTFSPTHSLSAALRERERDRDMQRGWWDGRICIKLLLSQQTQGGSLPLSSASSRTKGDKITAQEALKQHNPTRSALSWWAKTWLLFHTL